MTITVEMIAFAFFTAAIRAAQYINYRSPRRVVAFPAVCVCGGAPQFYTTHVAVTDPGGAFKCGGTRALRRRVELWLARLRDA